MDVNQERAEEIALLNDVFRRSGMRCMVTRGVSTLEDPDGLMRTVRSFDDFNEDNDPYGEHDFGSFDWSGEQLFWKIDYYDPELRRYADPLSDECTRVLTIMLAREY